MEGRPFGAPERLVPVIGQGTWMMEQDDRASAVAALRRGIDLGMTHLDTAEMYGSGRVEEVRGPGVVGAQPRLEPGQHFEYTSGCVLSTPHGTMHGTYEMKRDDGGSFQAAIAPFSLSMPYTLN